METQTDDASTRLGSLATLSAGEVEEIEAISEQLEGLQERRIIGELDGDEHDLAVHRLVGWMTDREVRMLKVIQGERFLRTSAEAVAIEAVDMELVDGVAADIIAAALDEEQRAEMTRRLDVWGGGIELEQPYVAAACRRIVRTIREAPPQVVAFVAPTPETV